MKAFLVGEDIGQRYELVDPDAMSETEFEFAVAKVLSKMFTDYRCVVFTGTFRLDEEGHRPDLALVAKDFSHWFVIEVELTSHSFYGHVLPQVRAFRYGTPQPDCATILARELEIGIGRAVTLVQTVPYVVAVVANKREHSWESPLDALGVQFLNVGVYSLGAERAYGVDGALYVLKENLGFGTYSAVDRSLRLPRATRLPVGKVQVEDPAGATAIWEVALTSDAVWVTKEYGAPDIPNGVLVQVLRTVDGRISLRWRSE